MEFLGIKVHGGSVQMLGNMEMRLLLWKPGQWGSYTLFLFILIRTLFIYK